MDYTLLSRCIKQGGKHWASVKNIFDLWTWNILSGVVWIQSVAVSNEKNRCVLILVLK